ncbi:putative cation transporter [Aspergillus clavatus NRRL 1]|uniref:Potassium transport protein n=1 Tax=Aspergillus clavatus (strain ATCC 1007 / CBS 513.65 / DSM 816 / NCTC 3887 / NRRL 1 / QM 1276 / 107) TaxID=344612 RepID=A1C8P3_ASPCL|nr:cation transporter, putative [Aspergillus clavatus NRRL 1]EAW13680.1 cation transporter, putative [Aspergillus clavatus NRRL 1]
MNRIYKFLKNHRPRVRFLTLHYAYFTTTCFIGSIILWASSHPLGSLRYIDALFLAFSAMTLTGLNTVNLSTLNLFQQLLLLFLIMLGSTIWVSIAVLLTRRRAFERRFGDIIREQRLRRWKTSGSLRAGLNRSLTRSLGQLGSSSTNVAQESEKGDGLRATGTLDRRPTGRHDSGVGDETVASVLESTPRHLASYDAKEHFSLLNRASTGDRRPSFLHTMNSDDGNHVNFAADVRPHGRPSSAYSRIIPAGRRLSKENIRHCRHPDPHMCPEHGHLSFLRHFGRNATAPELTDEERDRLGGIEYRAVCLLTVIVPLYFVLWQVIGGLAVAAYVARNKAGVTERNGMNPWWAGFFFGISAFNNSGMSLVDANMVPFRSSIFMLITMGLLILAGNTCYPIFLRCILYGMKHLLPKHKYFREMRATLRFVLKYPRRCYTNLFPAQHTWWLLCLVIVLNGIDWAAFEILNIDNPAVTSIPLGPRVLDGLFQALCVRNSGFFIANISTLQLGMQLIYLVMMYISVYPVVITMRNSNVYEERSLGIYADDSARSQRASRSPPASRTRPRAPSSIPKKSPSRRLYFVQQQLRAQLAYDLWWIALAVIVICIVEAGNFTRHPVTYSAFNIIFETVSAYGTVGLSTGLPDETYSFSGGWHTLSKLVLCAVMLRGRHRGLPVAIDKAILLPAEHLMLAEREDTRIRRDRTRSWNRGMV